ncbi:MAG TPA: adenylate/guanylate cyclase domain-containing protein, partial [Candidatus Saccharimonadia bacterium]|nr:adenylate/guanylate cyclase domain-containing protein [Candidatus Saccharimonadia bacterium]
MLYADSHVVDDAGRGLRWTGEPLSTAQRAFEGVGRFYGEAGVLWLVRALLQHEGRVSYRTLRQVFGFDEATLADVRIEILFKQLAIDEDGQGLVWTGHAPLTAVPTPPPASADSAPGETTDARLPAVADSAATPPPAPARDTPEAERRQLTVLFCDLVDSTQLSQQLDPEDLRQVVRAYQETAAVVIQRFEGHIAQYLGDGLLVYCGYPRAHEDDAQRAVLMGLGIVEALGALNSRLQAEYGVALAVRLGIHTGPVVVGAMGGGGRHEHLALGETPNIAARLEGLAAPNTVVISAITAQLVQRAFVLEALGTQALKGITAPMGIWQVVGPQETLREAATPMPEDVKPLVGRGEEVGLMVRRWEQSKAGQGQVVLISGEAGIGKSALVDTLRAQVRREGLTRVALRCSPYHTNSALYPVIAHVQQALRFERHDTAEEKLAKLEQALQTLRLPLHEVVPLMAALLAVPLPDGRYPPLHMTPLQQRQQTYDALVAWMLEEAERQPVLMVWEDLHWADPSTLEILGLHIDQAPTAPLFHLLTFRPEFVPPWPARSHMTPLTLHRLERPQVEAMIVRLANGKTLPVEVLEHIVSKTDGVPLFIEELTKMLLESALLQEEAEHYALTGPLAAVTIPTTLYDSLMARLDRLPTVRWVAQRGAVLGREFAYELLQALMTMDEATLQHGLTQLVDAELLYQRGRPPRARYIFKHALIQDAAYASLLKSTRQQYHQQTAQLLEARFPEIVAAEPELLAHHYTEAGCPAPAVGYWQQAGTRALQRSANVEAIAHVQHGLELLATLPDTPQRTQHELDLLTTLGPALMSIKGYGAPEVAQAYTRARELCQQAGETPEHFLVLYNLWVFYIIRAEHQTALALGEQCFQAAQRVLDETLLLMAHFMLGASGFCLGNPTLACTHLEHMIALYDPQQHHVLAYHYGGFDPGIIGLIYSAWTLWLRGYPAQAHASIARALSLAQQLAHPFTLARMLYYDALFWQLHRDVPAVRAQAEAAITVATAQRFALVQALGPIMRGWAIAVQEHSTEGLVQIRQGLDMYRSTGAELQRPHLLTLLAEASGLLDQPEGGLAALEEALTLVEKTGERYYEAELHRQRGELLLLREAKSHPAQDSREHHEAEAC